MNIKLAITGAHSTGKTTLINYIETQFPELKVEAIKGVSRGVIKRGFPMAKEATEASFANYIGDQLRLQRNYSPHGNDDVLLVDRCIACAIGYAQANRTYGYKMPDYFLEMMREVALLESRFFHCYVYLPIEFQQVPDGVRPDDEPYRNAVSAEILAVLQCLRFPIHVVRGTMQERASKVYCLLRELSLTQSR